MNPYILSGIAATTIILLFRAWVSYRDSTRFEQTNKEYELSMHSRGQKYLTELCSIVCQSGKAEGSTFLRLYVDGRNLVVYHHEVNESGGIYITKTAEVQIDMDMGRGHIVQGHIPTVSGKHFTLYELQPAIQKICAGKMQCYLFTNGIKETSPLPLLAS